jgi:hypothetical protein
MLTFVCTSLLVEQDVSLSSLGPELSTCEDDDLGSHSPSSVDGVDCDDCDNEDCSNSNNCCQNIGHGSVFFISKNNISILGSRFLSNIDWVLYNHYRSPFINPTLKPPLFS